MDREEKYEYWLANVRGVRGRIKRRLRGCVNTAKELYYIEETKLRTLVEREEEVQAMLKSIRTWELESEYEKLKKSGAVFYSYFHEAYPEELKALAHPPYAIYLKGKPIKKNSVKAAIVGARQCSSYGERMAIAFAEKLAEAEVDVISGLGL